MEPFLTSSHKEKLLFFHFGVCENNTKKALRSKTFDLLGNSLCNWKSSVVLSSNKRVELSPHFLSFQTSYPLEDLTLLKMSWTVQHFCPSTVPNEAQKRKHARLLKTFHRAGHHSFTGFREHGPVPGAALRQADACIKGGAHADYTLMCFTIFVLGPFNSFHT